MSSTGDKRPESILVVVHTRAGEVLLLQRCNPPDYWQSVTGSLEWKEGAVGAARREVHEETGIDETDFEWGDRHIETGPYSRGKTARYYLAQTEQATVVMGPSPETGEPEHHEWRWVTFDEAYDLASPRVRSVVQWARQIIGS